ncbi:MAG: hypothetical protein HFI31_03475 [Lachnospiraceae bacterium]|jgi:hypothetical protein|nr:hypothetical protein [Lachnospiraceae bacterium]MCI8996469.1 hypothetical protein [Lachnospiraceae bacterium]MCI9133240.1 hypothetical protein [Lachnospiraceae bacterium]
MEGILGKRQTKRKRRTGRIRQAKGRRQREEPGRPGIRIVIRRSGRYNEVREGFNYDGIHKRRCSFFF